MSPHSFPSRLMDENYFYPWERRKAPRKLWPMSRYFTFGTARSSFNYMPFFVPRFIHWFCLAALFLLGPTEAQEQRKKLTSDIREIVLENRFLSRKFALDKGLLRTS